ncbi:MAG: AMP-binding protein [Oceanipulchritudo sp.]
MKGPLDDILAEIWQACLPETRIHPESNFFSLGGDSLAATSMILEVERKTGCPVPIGQIYLTPILSDFAQAIRDLDPNESAPLYIPLKEGDGTTLLFAIAPAMGGVFHFRELAEALPEGVGFSVVEPRVSASGEHNYASIEEIAEDAIEVIRNKQPQGPYHLLGYSFGGILAWAMARKLEEMAEETALLAFLDSSCRNGYRSGTEASLAQRILAKRRFLIECARVRKGYGEKLHLQRCIPLLSLKIRNSIRNLLPGGTSMAHADPARAMEVPAQRLLREAYSPGTFRGRVHLFRSEKQLTLHRELDYDLGWSAHLPEGGPDISTVPGDHFTLVKHPHAATLARAIVDLMENEQARHAGIVAKEIATASSLAAPPFPEPVNGECLCERFLTIADAFPDHAAVRDGGARLTYRQLREKARRVAAFLLRRDPEGSGPVLLHFDTSWQFICAVYGTLLAGRCYLPVDPAFPARRILEIITLSGARIALCPRPERLEPAISGAVTVLSFSEALASAEEPAVHLPVPASPDSDAMLLFTSGSTGKPKGTPVPRKMILHVAWRRSTAAGFDPSDRYALPYVSAFMGAAMAIHGAVLSGSTICIYNLRRRGVQGLPAWLRRERISVLHIITSVLRNFLQSWQGNPDLPDLRLLIPGGERSRLSDIALWKSCCRETVRYATCLGSTECGTLVLTARDSAFDPGKGPIPLGIPFRSLGVRILRGDGTVANPGEEGQIVVESHYIFRGYTGEGDLNRGVLSFTPEGKSVYLTGDFGFLDEEGNLYNLGRRDARVKVMGTLVELAEVESVIMLSGLVREAVVLHRPVSPDDPDKHLVAFVVPNPGDERDLAKRLTGELLNRLPKAMIPYLWITLPRFPTTENGKTDRRALASLEIRQ